MNKKILGFMLAVALLLPCTALANGTDASPYRITVNLTKNIVTVYGKDSNGGYTTPKRAFVCSVGGGTPTGTFQTTNKYVWRPLFGNVYGQYATRITGSILFHSVPYLKQDKSTLEYDEYNKLGTTASAGCIRLTVADAKWIYDNCPSGTVVEMYRGGREEPLMPEMPAKIDTTDSRKGWDPTDPDPANPWKNFQAAQARISEADEPETIPEWLEPLLEETPENIVSADPQPAASATVQSVAEPEADETPPDWLKPLLEQSQSTEPADVMPEMFQLQASGRETTNTVKALRTGADCFLLEQDARQAFAHLGITLLFQRQGNGAVPSLLYQKTAYHISSRKIGGQMYYSLQELAEIIGVETMTTPNGGYALRRQDSKVWVDPI